MFPVGVCDLVGTSSQLHRGFFLSYCKYRTFYRSFLTSPLHQTLFWTYRPFLNFSLSPHWLLEKDYFVTSLKKSSFMYINNNFAKNLDALNSWINRFLIHRWKHFSQKIQNLTPNVKTGLSYICRAALGIDVDFWWSLSNLLLGLSLILSWRWPR